MSFLLWLAVVVLIQAPTSGAPADADTAALARLETEWNVAHVRGDAARLHQLFAVDLVAIDE